MIKLLVRVDVFPLEWTVTKKDCPEEQAIEGKYLYAVWSVYQKHRTMNKKKTKKNYKIEAHRRKSSIKSPTSVDIPEVNQPWNNKKQSIQLAQVGRKRAQWGPKFACQDSWALRTYVLGNSRLLIKAQLESHHTTECNRLWINGGINTAWSKQWSM